MTAVSKPVVEREPRRFELDVKNVESGRSEISRYLESEQTYGRMRTIEV
jgi:hypothetical protein